MSNDPAINDELKLKTLEAKDLAGRINEDLRRDDLSIEDYIDLLRVCPPSDLIANEYLNLLTYQARNTIIDQAEHIRLKALILMGLKEMFFKMDVLSLLGGLNYTNEKKYIPWLTFNTSVLTLGVEKGGKFILISGNMGSGKTHLASLLAYDIVENKQLKILSNINFLDNDKIIKVYTTSELLMEGLKCSIGGIKWVAVLDESGVWQHTQDHGTKKNIEWDKLYRLVRKFDGSMIFIDQRSLGFTRTIKEFASVHLQKYSKNTVKIDLMDIKLKGQYYLRSVPDTPFKFDTNDIAYFRHDINMDQVLSKATSITGSVKQKKSILEFLESTKENTDSEGVRINDKEVAIFLKNKSVELGYKLTNEKIANLLGANSFTVANWIRQNRQKNENPI